jgi:hypothetical protein
MFFVGAMAISVLVGFSIDHLRQIRWSSRAKRRLTRLTLIFGGLALMMGLGLALGFGQAQRAAFALAIFVPLGLAIILLWARRILSSQVSLILLGLLLILDLLWFDISMMRFVPPEETLSIGRPAAEYLAKQSGPFRVYSPSYSLPMQTVADTGLQLADGVEPVHLAVYDKYMAHAGGYNDAGFSVTIPNFGNGEPGTALKDTEPNLDLLGMLNVTHLAAAYPMNWPGLTLDTKIGDTYIYHNQKALPRAWIAHQALPAKTDWLNQLESLPGLSNVVLLEDETTQIYPPLASNDQTATPAIVTHYSANRIDLEAEIKAPGWLVLSEIWYPGWQATINGSTQPVEKVNGLLRGIYLEYPGEHQISVTYQPKSVIWGGWISVVTVGIILIVGGLLLYRNN